MSYYPISKDWDCKYSLEDLINMYDDSKCFLEANYRKHKSDNCYGRFILLFETENNNFIEIGIKEDGFVYIGDRGYLDEKNTKLFDIKKALDFMMTYRNLMNDVCDFENKLNNTFNESCINIIYDYDYSLLYKYGKDLTYREDNRKYEK